MKWFFLFSLLDCNFLRVKTEPGSYFLRHFVTGLEKQTETQDTGGEPAPTPNMETYHLPPAGSTKY